MKHTITDDQQDLLSIVQPMIAAGGLSCVTRSARPDIWDDVLDLSGHAPALLTDVALKFQCVTNASRLDRLADLSLVVETDGVPIAAWPLGLARDQRGLRYGTCGLCSYAPMFNRSAPPRLQKRAVKAMVTALVELANRTGVTRGEDRLPWNPHLGLDPWSLHWLEMGAQLSYREELYADLRDGYQRAFANVRKSYRPLVAKALREWVIEAHQRPSHVVWDEFRQLHALVAGRVTRDARSWETTFESFEQDKGLFVSLRDQAGAMVGGAFFQLSGDEASYAVAAYRRDLFDKPLGHGAQAVAMKACVKLGISWLYLGPTVLSGIGFSDKERSIAMFKRGFASQVMAVPSLVFDIKASRG